MIQKEKKIHIVLFNIVNRNAISCETVTIGMKIYIISQIYENIYFNQQKFYYERPFYYIGIMYYTSSTFINHVYIIFLLDVYEQLHNYL